jgi:hypothetical protein
MVASRIRCRVAATAAARLSLYQVRSEVSYYNSLVEIHPSARKHGIADENIEHAMRARHR